MSSAARRDTCPNYNNKALCVCPARVRALGALTSISPSLSLTLAAGGLLAPCASARCERARAPCPHRPHAARGESALHLCMGPPRTPDR
eukprot:scaffold5143_cov119-Isochrysis_galbana.AAC.22